MTYVNQTALELYIVPADERHIDDDTFNKPQVNFTWKAESFENDELWLKVSFD